MGEILLDGVSNLFGRRRHPNSALCPIRAIGEYVAYAQTFGIGLIHGYLFRPTDQTGHAIERPFFSATAEHR